MDNNRTILAVVLIVLLWSGYSLFFSPQVPLAPVVAVEDVATTPKDVTATAMVQPGSIPQVAVDSSIEESFVTVSSSYYDIKVTSVGAAVHSITLKNYRETNDADSALFKLIDGDALKLPTLKTFGSDGLHLPVNLNYKIIDSKKVVNIDNKSESVSFVASTDDLTVIKTYTFHPVSYSFDLNIQLVSNAESVSGKLNLSLVSPWNKDDDSEMYTFVGPVTFNGEELEEDKPGKLEESPKIYKSNVVWTGYASKYFLNAISPAEPVDKLFITAGDGYVENRLTAAHVNLPREQKASFSFSTYFGPKQDEFLVAGGHHFQDAIHYGFFHPLSKPLMVVLKFFYDFIGNFGISIVLLTICIKLIFWPLTQKSYKSMKGMQKLQPEMKKMREKYGKDKQKLNQEMMSFYKDNKVNPLGGCLPMVIQIPVFFALYRVLLGSIELRHAPYYVTPLIMGVTMFIQQKMTPTNMDPMQEKIMLMMPVVFTFMFLNFPAGLVIYWLTNNLLTILQQYLIRRQPD